MSSDQNQEVRKTSDILLSIEEKMTLLIKTIAAGDLNNRLILDRLNKMLTQNNTSNISDANATKIIPPPTVIEMNQEPAKMSRKQPPVQFAEETIEKLKEKKAKASNISKIPIGQRITDQNGKDIFNAKVKITNLQNQEVLADIRTNAQGKWATYLGVGKYSVHMIKSETDPDPTNKIECLQEIEVLPGMKSLQLPVISIKR